jgi:glutathione S-transferase
MIELHTMAPAWDLPTFTPFGLKLIAYLQMAGLPFRIVVEQTPTGGPTKKFPWIVDGDRTFGDTAVIVDYLAAQYGDRVDGWLSVGDRAASHAIRRMVEEGLCFVLLHLRWVDDATFRAATDVALRAAPAPLRRLFRPLLRRRILRDLWGQGVLRLPAAAVLAMGRADLDALEALLGEKPFVLGAQPSSVDATVAAFMAVLVLVPLENDLKRHALSLPRLAAYTQRMAARYFTGPAEGL